MFRSRLRSRVGLAFCLGTVLACGDDGAGDDGALIGGGGEAGAGAGGGGASGNGGSGGMPSIGGTGGTLNIDVGGSGGTGEPTYVEQNLIEFRVEPEDVVLNVALGESQQLEYRAFGRYAAEPN